MSEVRPRLRMFAGPNGSGKSTLKEALRPEWLGVYINADEIEKAIREDGFLGLRPYGILPSDAEWRRFLADSTLLNSQGLSDEARYIKIVDDRVVFDSIKVNSYHASALAGFLRGQLVGHGISFTFETVMSSSDKVEFLCAARQAGFRTYLYYVATEDPEINVSRVAYRVSQGGHPVSREKIVSRYQRSLDLLPNAVTCADRAYVFDNSDSDRVWIAEITDGRELELKADLVPYWFKKALLDRFLGDSGTAQQVE